MPAKFDPKEWSWWQAALKARDDGLAKTLIGSDDLPIFEERPMTGYYRIQGNANGPFFAIQYWYDAEDGALNCIITGSLDRDGDLNYQSAVDARFAKPRWTYAARNPVSQAEYEAYLEMVEAKREDADAPEPVWHDEVRTNLGGKSVSSHEKLPEQPKPEPEEPKRARAPRKPKEEPKPEPVVEQDLDDDLDDDWGSIPAAPAPEAKKAPPEADSREEARRIAQEVKTRKAAPVTKPEPIVEDDEPAPRSNTGSSDFDQWHDDLLELVRDLNKVMPKEQIGRKSDADKLADMATRLRDHLKTGDNKRTDETKPLRDQVAEINARWNDAIKEYDDLYRKSFIFINEYLARENAKLRAAEEEARKAAEESGEEPASGSRLPQKPQKKASVGSRRSVSAVTRKVAVIDDYKKVAAYFAGMDTIAPDLAEVLRKLAGKAMSAGVSVPGAHQEDVTGAR